MTKKRRLVLGLLASVVLSFLFPENGLSVTTKEKTSPKIKVEGNKVEKENRWPEGEEPEPTEEEKEELAEKLGLTPDQLKKLMEKYGVTTAEFKQSANLSSTLQGLVGTRVRDVPGVDGSLVKRGVACANTASSIINNETSLDIGKIVNAGAFAKTLKDIGAIQVPPHLAPNGSAVFLPRRGGYHVGFKTQDTKPGSPQKYPSHRGDTSILFSAESGRRTFGREWSMDSAIRSWGAKNVHFYILPVKKKIGRFTHHRN